MTDRMTPPSPNPRRPAGAPVAAAQVPGRDGLLALAVGVVVVAGLYFGRDVLIPITLAVILSFVLSPIVMRLRAWRFPKGLAVFVSVLLALGAIGAIGTVVGTQAASLAGDAPQYARTVETKVANLQRFATDRFAALNRQFAPQHAPAAPPATAAGPGGLEGIDGTGNTGRAPVAVRVVEEATSPLTVARNILHPILAPFETFVIVLVVAIFILMQKEDLRDRMIRLFGSSDLHRTTSAMDDAASRLSRYFLSQLAVNTGFGIVIGVGTWAIGLPVPIVWGVLAGILRFVPYIGSLLAAAAPLAVAAAVDPGWSMAIWVAVLFAVCEPVIGYVVEPLLYGHSTGLSPLSVVLAAVFWTWIWGPVGLVLSMPLTLLLVVLGRHVPSMEFLDVLLGDRPALTPVESFYQRMLADAPEEALEQADVLLKDRSLTAYYDEVALSGLKLAAEDARRGAIDHPRAARLVQSMLELVDDLADTDDARPAIAAGAADRDLAPLPPAQQVPIAETRPVAATAPDAWRAPGSVLCVAGRGVLDDAVTAMLEQLLAKRGFGVERVAHDAVGRDAITRLDLARAKLVCLSYLEIGGSPAHLRSLVRRLRQAAEVPVLVGLWPEGEAALDDAEIQARLGADIYVGTLGGAVERALALAEEGASGVPAAASSA